VFFTAAVLRVPGSWSSGLYEVSFRYKLNATCTLPRYVTSEYGDDWIVLSQCVAILRALRKDCLLYWGRWQGSELLDLGNCVVNMSLQGCKVRVVSYIAWLLRALGHGYLPVWNHLFHKVLTRQVVVVVSENKEAILKMVQTCHWSLKRTWGSNYDTPFPPLATDSSVGTRRFVKRGSFRQPLVL
jgi:hypothetical protein